MGVKRHVVIVAEAESFIVRGLEMKLGTVDVKSTFGGKSIGELAKYEEKADLFIVYLDDNIISDSDLLTYLASLCSGKEKVLCMIGSKSEYDSALRLINKDYVWKWFERPLNMDEFLEEIKKFMTSFSIDTMKRNILIVDDDLDYMHMIREWLKDSYKVSMVNSGIQAITWLAKNNVDLILLDYEMPVTSGPQVLEMLRSEATTRDIPVMFLTGKSDRDSIMQVLSLKPTGYLLKSITNNELHSKLREYFDKN
ncbi:MAG: response regulator [Eubacterium sp.]|nr:response regulator [Eubacterium sp.]